MPVVAGTSFTATLVDPGGITTGLGARVEVPVTRAIVAAFQLAVLNGDTWTVTLDAPLDPGDFNLVWRTNDAEPPRFEAFVPLIVVSSMDPALGEFPDVDRSTAGVRPTTDQVAKIMRTRTKNADTGQDEGTFTSTTFPPVADVDATIDDGMTSVLSRLPAQIDPELYDQVNDAIRYQTAIIIENSFFRTQEGTSGQSVSTYVRLLSDIMTRLTPSTTRYDGLY